MEFANDRHRAAYERVEGITSKYDDFGAITEAPGFVLMAENARIFLLVVPWTPEDTVLQVRAYPEIDLNADQDLANHLLTMNAQVVLGAWGWEDGRVFYQHTILADNIDEATFNATMSAVVGTVHAQIATLTARWGIGGPSDADDASGAVDFSGGFPEAPNA